MDVSRETLVLKVDRTTEVQKIFEETGILLTMEKCQQFEVYWEVLLKWNAKASLVSKKDEQRVLVRHFLESALLCKLDFFFDSARILDFGTGGGFPGLPIKIVRPDIEMVLLDSKRWKTLFLRNVVSLFAMDSVLVINERAEDLVQEDGYRHGFDFVVSRAVCEMHKLFLLTKDFLKVNGKLLAIKGPNVTQEVQVLQLNEDVDVEILSLPSHIDRAADRVKLVVVKMK